MNGRIPDRGLLERIARQAMAENGLEPDFPPQALEQLAGIPGPDRDPSLPDLTGLPWCSIDNDDSRDLDQLSAAQRLPNGGIRVLVAVADVDGRVSKNTPLDLHAQKNTTTVYTGVATFPMLPERLSTDLTSLSPNEERTALVVEMTLDGEGRVGASRILRARVLNRAQLAYNGVGAWLEGRGPLPEAAARVPGMEAQLRLQDEAAQRLVARRHEHGALALQTLQPRPVTQDGLVVDLALEVQNRAGQLIEDFMVAANGATARFLTAQGFPTLRRVVRKPKRWDRIVSVAASLGETLPGDPDPK
ncbi:MAG TPA: ribonuclease catalytic domain-containing protein, partial [bacterium]|nr:ribonuclease catalytic domain-containing protein [bacterium]